MNILILLKNSPLDVSIVNFTASVFNDDSVKLHLLNLIEVNGEIPTKPSGEVLDVCTEFDLSDYHDRAQKNQVYLTTFNKDSIQDRRSMVGDRIKLIKHYIANHSIDLIVGGSHKTSRIEDLFVKTFTSSIIEKIDIPFLTIKCNRDEFKPSKIGIIRAFMDPKTEDLSMIKRMAAFHQSEIVLVKIRTKDDKRPIETIEAKMNLFASLNNLSSEHLILDRSNKEKGLNTIVGEHLVDLIALEKTERIGFLPFLGKDESKTLVNHIYAPILIY